MSNSEPKYTFESHGEGYALYEGRTEKVHGYNIANLTDIDTARLNELLRLANLSLISTVKQ